MFNRLIALAAPNARLAPDTAGKEVRVKSAAATLAAAAKKARPAAEALRGEELVEGLNEDASAGEIEQARGAIVTELAAQGLAAPDAILASGGYRLQGVGDGLVAVGVRTDEGAFGAIGGKSDQGAWLAGSAKSDQGQVAGLVSKDAKGNTFVAGGIKLADGASFGKWVVEGANGGALGADRWKDGKGNSGGLGFLKLGDLIIAKRWLKGANGDSVIEHALVNKRTKTMTYQVTAVINGKLVSASATVKL